ncbi:MAG: hypothetical protein QOE93_1373 [Actinomycetota bacterium]|jgi:hypothetical protein|nr:hypothetical protein [Actinomycetota bacterium]
MATPSQDKLSTAVRCAPRSLAAASDQTHRITDRDCAINAD